MAIRCLCCALLSIFALLLPTSVARAAAAEEKADKLDLSRVVLFTSGVGYFEHRGDVIGDAQIDLKFNVNDINDLLKSLVLEDQGGGKISTVSYGSQEPIAKTLRTFSIDLSRRPTLGELLDQARGEEVTFEGPVNVTGKIISVEHRTVPTENGDPLDVEVVNLLTKRGLRSVRVDTAGEIRFASERLNSELQDALGILAERHSREKKNVSLRFTGEGKRPVRVGYIQESPLWKTSYRLVLKEDGPPLLQGWAIVENTTEHDWRDVRLGLVNGRPISFVMDLYRPLYLARPVVAPETFGSLKPQLHSQDLASGEQGFRSAAHNGAIAGGMGGGMGGGMMGGMGGGMGANGFGLNGGQIVEPAPEVGGLGPGPIDPAAGVDAAAKAGDVGELFRYEIDQPVSLARQESAMLPIVNGAIEGEKVSLYNPTVQTKHPLSAVQLTNTTDLHLMQGPITVFDGGEYAGDARIEDLAPGGRRLISYALDLDTEIAVEHQSEPEALTSVRVRDGVLHVEKRLRRGRTYVVKNSGGRSKNILVEQPIQADWKIKQPEPAEKTGELYRFAVAAEPGRPATLRIEEERPIEDRVAISTLDSPDAATIYLDAAAVSPAIKEAIKEFQRRRHAIVELNDKQADLTGTLSALDAEQDRIRRNMAQLDRNSDLYKRYVQKLNSQEDQIEKLRKGSAEIKGKQTALAEELSKFLESLSID